MGASLTDWVSHRFVLSDPLRRALLLAGVAGGFGSVFGTPWAGAVFALEFVVLARFQWSALVPVVVASFVGDLTTRTLGIEHASYPQVAQVGLSVALLLKWGVFAAAVAVVSRAFIALTHVVKHQGERIQRMPVRMFFAGVAVVGLWQLSGTDELLGLGVPTILRAFADPSVPHWFFAGKMLFTAVTVGAGFLGGEVTPLFFVGATLGNALAQVLGIPLELAVGVGLAAVFGTAANAPIALSVMAAELMGIHVLPHVLLVVTLAYLLSGHASIYPSQRLLRTKWGRALDRPTAIRDLRG